MPRHHWISEVRAKPLFRPLAAFVVVALLGTALAQAPAPTPQPPGTRQAQPATPPPPGTRSGQPATPPLPGTRQPATPAPPGPRGPAPGGVPPAKQKGAKGPAGVPGIPGATPGIPGIPGAAPVGTGEGGEEGLPDWALWLLITVGLSVAAIIVFVVIDQSKKKPKKKLTVNNDQIGSYRIVSLMQTGSTSQVWEVSEFGSGRHFAIKMLLPEVAHDPHERNLLFHEAEVGQKLAHPNIIRVVSIVRDKDHPHVVMDFFPGGNFKLRIQRKEWDFIKEHAHSILKQVATTLAFINMKGWVHRDVKPENVLVDANGEVRLIDFAIAQPIKSGVSKAFHRKKGQTQGTPSYMSPEQIRNEPLDGRADIYSYGAMAYEIVTGRPPFRAASRADLLQKHLTEKPESPCIHNPAVHPDFAALVLKMLEKDREKRPASFHKVLEQLKTIRVFRVEVSGKEKTGGMQGR